MAITARLDLSVWRNDDVCEIPIRVRGLDLSGATMAMEVRLAPDTPGAPLARLDKVGNGNAEGLRVAGVSVVNGVPETDLRLRFNRSTRQALPYAGEVGDSTRLSYALVLSGKTRLVGGFVVLAHSYASDAAPSGRPSDTTSGVGPAASAGALLTIAENDVISVSIDGIDLVAAEVTQAGSFATAAAQESSAANAARIAAQQARDEAAAHATAAAANGAYPTIAAGLAATAAGGYFSVIGDDDAFLTLYREVDGAAVLVTVYPSLTGVRSAVAGAEYIARMRAVLRRCFTARKLPAAGYLRQVASRTIGLSRKMTTDGSNIPLYRPDGTGAYNSFWIRDMSMAAHSAPELFPAQELRDAFEWYAAKVDQSSWWVPDHIGAGGEVSFRAGNDDLGVRAPLDGNPMLVQLAWLAYAKADDNTIWPEWGDFLTGVLDGMDYDATGCVAIPAGQESPGFGFVDSVRLNGSHTILTAFTFNAYRQCADMAFAAGDLVSATYCIGRAETLFAALNGTAAGLWAGSNQTDANDGPNGLFRFTNGTLSYNQLDVWGSAYITFVDAAMPERCRAISTTLSLNYYGMQGNAPQLVTHGGIRHVLAGNEFTVGSQVFESYLLPPTYNQYQSGPGWPTPNVWIAWALGLTRPDLAAAFIREVLREVNLQTRRDAAVDAAQTYATITAGRDATPTKGYFKVNGEVFQKVLTDAYQGVSQVRKVVPRALLSEWVSRDPGPTDDQNGEAVIGNGVYLTSICAVVGMDAALADAVDMLESRATIPSADVPLPQGAWTKVPFSVRLMDGIGAHNSADSSFTTLSGAVVISASVRCAVPSNVGEMLLAIFVNGQMERVIDDRLVSIAGGVTLAGTHRFDPIAMGSRIDVRVQPVGAAAIVQNLDGDNARYSTMTVEWAAP